MEYAVKLQEKIDNMEKKSSRLAQERMFALQRLEQCAHIKEEVKSLVD